jgi:type IV secretory pathway ATPase VirB11/archaellum biosynthesis ATPase
MREVVRALVKYTAIDEAVLADAYSREYSGFSLDALKEIAQVLENYQYWSPRHLTLENCERCRRERKEQVGQVLEKLAGDPLRAFADLREMKTKIETRTKRGAEQCKRCRKNFLRRVINPLISTLEQVRLVNAKPRRGRKGYASVLIPSISPCFIKSKIKLKPPESAELVDAYELNDSEVRIYHLPHQLQHLYFLIPPEYHLPPEQVLLLQKARQALLEQEPEDLELGQSQTYENVKHLGQRLLANLAVDKRLDVGQEKIKKLANYLTKYTLGLGVLETLLTDEKVQDIYVDAPIGKTPLHIYHQDFEECLTNIFLTPEDTDSLVSRFRAISGRPFSEADPVLDLNLGGVRVAAIQKPLSPEGVALALRRHKPTPWTLPQFVVRKFLTPKAAGLLSLLVDSQMSILVTGSRGAGKTSLLGALMLELLPRYRVLCLEDTSELPVDQLRGFGFKIQSMRVQPAVADSTTEMKAEDALRAALRLGESVLVVGEVRGPETKSLYEAMRVGAAGNSVMGTIHGSTAKDVFERVVYDLEIPPSSFKATDAIIVAAPIRLGGSISRARRLTQITEVRKGWRSDPFNENGFVDLMTYDPSRDKLAPTSILLQERSHLIKAIARKWSVKPPKVLRNLQLRAKIQENLVKAASRLGKPELLEAEFVVQSNLTFHRLLEEELKNKKVGYDLVLKSWRKWLEEVA